MKIQPAQPSALLSGNADILKCGPWSSTEVILEVHKERQRQVEVEGYTHEHDDMLEKGQLARAASAYALNSVSDDVVVKALLQSDPLAIWPWPRRWWKPKTPRQDLIRAAALIIAEIERRDRAQAATAADQACGEAATC